MRGYSYVIPRDYGFAPNPFGYHCTLATCKPLIRKKASIGDWILATGSCCQKLQGKLVFLMEVVKKITFEEYWECNEYQYKKPCMNGSLVQMYGDNIYHKKDGIWIQDNSHHSYQDGTPNKLNLNRDTSVNAVLISTNFYYFGRDAFSCGNELSYNITKAGRGYRIIDKYYLNQLIDAVRHQFDPGVIADPLLFTSFERYNGK